MRPIVTLAAFLGASVLSAQSVLTVVIDYSSAPVDGSQVTVVVADDHHCYEADVECRVVKAAALTPVTRVEIAGLVPGVYAVKCFIDTNDNGKLDLGWNNQPTEPNGFSNNAQRLGGLPGFDQAMFQVHEGMNVHRITLH